MIIDKEEKDMNNEKMKAMLTNAVSYMIDELEYQGLSKTEILSKISEYLNTTVEELLKMGDLVLCSVSIDAAIANNRQLLEPMQRHPKRDHFFQLLRDGKSVSCSMSFCFPYLSFKRLVKLVLTRMRMLKR